MSASALATKVLSLVINGVELPLRPTQASSTDNTIHGLLSVKKDGSRYYNAAGRAIDEKLAPKGKLPTTAVVDGVTVELKEGMTASEHTDRKTGVTTSKTPHPKREFNGVIALPSFGTERKVVVRVTDPREDGTFQVAALISGVGGGAQKAVKASDL